MATLGDTYHPCLLKTPPKVSMGSFHISTSDLSVPISTANVPEEILEISYDFDDHEYDFSHRQGSAGAHVQGPDSLPVSLTGQANLDLRAGSYNDLKSRVITTTAFPPTEAWVRQALQGCPELKNKVKTFLFFGSTTLVLVTGVMTASENSIDIFRRHTVNAGASLGGEATEGSTSAGVDGNVGISGGRRSKFHRYSDFVCGLRFHEVTIGRKIRIRQMRGLMAADEDEEDEESDLEFSVSPLAAPDGLEELAELDTGA